MVDKIIACNWESGIFYEEYRLISLFDLGYVFLKLTYYFKCSSEIFMRQFMISEIVKKFDSLLILDDTLTIDNVYERLEEEFGETNYGKVKYYSEGLYWIGYLIVIAYTMIYHKNKFMKFLTILYIELAY